MTNQSIDENDDDDGIDLDVLGILRRRYHLIALGLFVGVTLAAIYYAQQIPVYQSSLSVLVGHRSADINSASTGTLLEGATTMQSDILATHTELFRSPKILAQAIEKGNLNRSVGELSGNLSVSVGGQASILNASYKDTNPDDAAKILQAIYDSYQLYTNDQSRNVGLEAAELIANAQVANEESLRKADAEYRHFIANMPAQINASQDGSAQLQDIHQQRLSLIESELSGVRRSLAELKSRRARIIEFVRGRMPEEIPDSEVLAMLTPEELSRLEAFVTLNAKRTGDDDDARLAAFLTSQTNRIEYDRMMTLTGQLELARSSFGDGHPSVASLEAEVRNLQKYVAKAQRDTPKLTEEEVSQGTAAEMLRHYYNVLKSDIAGYEDRENELVEMSKVEAKLAKQVQLAFMDGNSLKADLDRAQRRYDEVFKRLQEINLTNDYVGFSTDLLVTPAPASMPFWPAKSKIAAMGLLGGLMFGFGLAMLAEFADRTFHNPDEVERLVGAPVLAHVPRLKESKLRKKAIPGSVMSPMVATHHLPRGNESETFRVLRTSVLFKCKSENKQVFLLTSPSPGDGKSTTISNLAVSMAQTGKRVLLVDADMRRPTIGKVLGIAGKVGLADYLESRFGFDSCLQETEQENLHVCTHGSHTRRPSELLESDRFVQFVADARERFDIVFIDTPPLLAVADPAIVAANVDGCLLAIRIEKNNRTLVERAAEILREHGKDIDGVIVNSRDSGSSNYGYSSYNYYGRKERGYEATYRRYYATTEGPDDAETTSDRRPPSRNGHAATNGKRLHRDGETKLASIAEKSDTRIAAALNPAPSDHDDDA